MIINIIRCAMFYNRDTSCANSNINTLDGLLRLNSLDGLAVLHLLEDLSELNLLV